MDRPCENDVTSCRGDADAPEMTAGVEGAPSHGRTISHFNGWLIDWMKCGAIVPLSTEYQPVM